jgi:hypothetical protein
VSSPLSLGAIARAKGSELCASASLSPHQLRVLRAVADCRTEALGGHRDRCERCAHEHLFWNSCRNRHCPGCGSEARRRWLDRRRAEVLDVPYFHVVFTLPDALRPLFASAPALLYAILLRSAAQTLLDVGATRLHAILGVLAILHTWTQLLRFHPHVHCVVPGGGLSLDGQRWVKLPAGNYLLSKTALSRRFRALFRRAVTEAFDDGALVLPPRIAADRTALDLLFALASKSDWLVYVKPPFGGPEQVLAYLANYTHRMAISNPRLQAFDGEIVTFSWRDREHGYAPRSESLPAVELLRRYLLHVVPPRFTRIRYFGYLSNRDRMRNLARARTLIGSSRAIRPRPPRPDWRLCPQCGEGLLRRVARVDPQRPRTWFDSS